MSARGSFLQALPVGACFFAATKSASSTLLAHMRRERAAYVFFNRQPMMREIGRPIMMI